MEVLRRYELRKNLQRLLERFWEVQTVLARTKGSYGSPFKMEWGVIQGYQVSPTILNISVDAVVQATLLEVCLPKEDQHGLGWVVVEQDIVSYAEDGCIAGRNPIWVQGTLTTLI